MKLQYICLDSTLDLYTLARFSFSLLGSSVRKWTAALGVSYVVNLEMCNTLKWVLLRSAGKKMRVPLLGLAKSIYCSKRRNV